MNEVPSSTAIDQHHANDPQSNNPEVIDSRETIVDRLKAFALFEVDRKYGRGDGTGENPKDYHNLIHTDGVMKAAGAIARLAAESGKIEDTDIVLVEIAAAYHDIEQDLGTGMNEEASADAAERQMREAGLFTDDAIKKVRMMISSTRTYFENGIMKQSVTEDILSQIMADADLHLLGSPTDEQQRGAIGLLYEISKTRTPTQEQERAFYQNQLRLLQNHNFYTEEASRLYPYSSINTEHAALLASN